MWIVSLTHSVEIQKLTVLLPATVVISTNEMKSMLAETEPGCFAHQTLLTEKITRFVIPRA